jgi:N-acetylglucosaminyldiphosphoundecaprenol N-acetyl-beta-D-mannosaminyltransferase
MMQTALTARPFGLMFSTASAQEIADQALNDKRCQSDGVALVVTPNIDHIAWLRRSKAMARAYAGAAVTVCDGWPVQLYARIRGLPVGRVTGCEIASFLMRADLDPARHRLFCVVDHPNTADSLTRWARQKGLGDAVAAYIPPFGFESDAALCEQIADRIAQHGTTVLLMGVGAPRSEIFVDTYRDRLPPCWAFCVGQAIKIELGMVTRAPRGWRVTGLEWLWRLVQEPRRLAGRYARSSVSFVAAVIEDQWRWHTGRSVAEGHRA